MKRIAVILFVVIYSFGQSGTKFGAGISLGTSSGIEAKIGNKWEWRLSAGYYGLLGKEKNVFLYDSIFNVIHKKYNFNVGFNIMGYTIRNVEIFEKLTIGFGAGFGYRQFLRYKHSYPFLNVEYIHTPEKVLGFYLVPVKLDYNINNYTVWVEGGFYIPFINELEVVAFSPLSDTENIREFMLRVGVFRKLNLGNNK